MSKSSEMSHFERKLFELVESGSPRQLLAFFKQCPIVSDNVLLRAVLLAVQGGNATLLQILMAGGADFRRGDPQLVNTILVTAVRAADLNNVAILTDEGILQHLPEQTSRGPTPLQAAVSADDMAMVDLLLSAGCPLTGRDSDGYTALHTIAQATYAERIVRAGALLDLVAGPRQLTALHMALEEDRLEVVRVLLDNKAKVDIPEPTHGFIPLHTAVLTGKIEAVDLLLQYKPCKQVNFVTHKLSRTALHLVINSTKCHSEIIRKLIRAGAKTDSQDADRNTPLLSALKNNKLVLATDILESTPSDQVSRSVLASDRDGNNALHVLCQAAGAPAAVGLMQILLRRTPDSAVAERVNGVGMTALTVAARNGHTAAARFLLDWGVNVNARSSYGSPMHVAVTVGNDDIALMLLKEEGLRFEACDKFGETVLHKAALVGNANMIHCILDRGISPILINHPGAKNRTVLHYLMKRSCLEIPQSLISRLVECGADVNVVDTDGDTPLIRAVKMETENTSNAAELMRLGCNVNITNQEGRSALHYACYHHRRDVVQLLMDHGADCNIQDKSGNTPLHVAASAGQDDILHLALQATQASSAQLGVLSEQKKTLLHYVAQLGLKVSFQQLLAAGALPDVPGAIPSPLILAAQNDHVDMVQGLLAYGALVNAQDEQGLTALMWAASQGHMTCLAKLIEHNADASLIDNSGDTALTKAAWGGHAECVRTLIPLTPELDHPEGEEGMSALSLAIAREHVTCVHLLLNAGANINLVDNLGNTALLTAAMLTSGTHILEMVLNCGQTFDINTVGDKGRTCLHWGVGEPESVELLLRYKPALNVLDNFRASPLLLAIAHKQPESARMLIDAGCSVDLVHDDGRKPIHHAAIYGDAETLRLLIQKGVDPDSPMKDGRSPLVLAAIENHTQVIAVLLQHNIKVNRIYFNAFTALSTAVSNQHLETTRLLLNHGANPDTIGHQKHRPFIQAILQNSIEAVVALVQAGADVDLMCLDDEQHPLYLATMKNAKMIKLLLQIGCQPNSLQRIVNRGLIEYFIEDEDLLRQIRYTAKQPWSLGCLCRGVLRRSIHCPLLANVQSTTLPQSLKDFILYKELDKFGNHIK